MAQLAQKKGLPLLLAEADLDFEGDLEDKEVDKWYATGSFTIMSNNYHFKIWVLTKSVIYLLDLYQVIYLAAQNFSDDNKFFENWNYFVTILNILDIFVSFITSVKV